MRTDLTLPDLARILSPFDLRPLAPDRSDRADRADRADWADPVAQGTRASKVRVATNGGPVFVQVNEGKREAELRYEGALLWHLGARRFPTPPPLRTSTGECFVRDGDRLISVFPSWPGHERPGGAAGEQRPPIETAIEARRAGRVGAILARLHLAAGDFAERRESPCTFERIVERVEAVRGPAGRVPALAEALPVIDEEIAFLREERARGARLPSGTIHGDLFPGNLLWTSGPRQRGGPAPTDERVSAVLDFEQAAVGRYVFDLAVTLLAWCWSEGPDRADGGRLDETLAWALVGGYQRVRPLGDEEREALWVEARTAALRFAVTRLTGGFLPSLPPASLPANPGQDCRDDLARLRFLRAAGREVLGVASDERPPLRAV